jgi:hypothetical protein
VLAKNNEIPIKQILLTRELRRNLANERFVFIAARCAKKPPAWQDFS